MKKAIILSLFFLLILLGIGFNIFTANKKSNDFFMLHDRFENMLFINNNLNIFIQSSIKYNNFDVIQKEIYLMNKNIEDILNNKSYINLKNKIIKIKTNKIKKIIEYKLELIERLKSNSAILNNSLRFINNINKNIDNEILNNYFILLISMEYNSEIDANELLKMINAYSYTTEKEKLFIEHSNIVLNYFLNFNKLKSDALSLKLNHHLIDLNEEYDAFFKKSLNKIKIIVLILVVLLIISLIFFLIYYYKIIKQRIELMRFKKAVESSDNIIVITDRNHNITYVNDEFVKSYGYSINEAVGKPTSILKSGKQSKEFYDNLKETINAGKKWHGEFINVAKDGKYTYEKASITPILNEKNEIEEFLAIKLDITKERTFQNELQKQEQMLTQQSKMAAMGEMLENIAHQWRQPLSVISMAASGIKMQKELNVLTDEHLMHSIQGILSNTNHLSQTIDDFRDFFKHAKEEEEFDLKDISKKLLSLVNSKLKAKDITIIEKTTSINIFGLKSELLQVLMNLTNNSIDALESENINEKMLFIDIYKEKDYAVIKIKDNANGIDKNIINRIFEPYFTTKHKSQGTGIGLYMSQEIITKHMNGSIEVNNVNFDYNEMNYTGAQFTIKLPVYKLNPSS